MVSDGMRERKSERSRQQAHECDREAPMHIARGWRWEHGPGERNERERASEGVREKQAASS